MALRHQAYATALIFCLCNCFNLCLYKLFKFSPDSSSEDKDEETVMSEFVEKLHSYELFTFPSRIYNKVLLFAHGIKTNSRSPLELKSYLEIEVPDEEQTTERPETLPPGNVPSDVENTQTDLRFNQYRGHIVSEAEQ